jgi:hypothetical protein
MYITLVVPNPLSMKTTGKKFIEYLYSNFTGNFLGFAIGMASTRLVAHFFTTRKLNNLWGLTARKTVVDKQTFSAMEWMISIVIGFVVFEIISKWVKKMVDDLLVKYRDRLPQWMYATEKESKSSPQPL